ncbi:Pyrophosphate-energised proton pump [Sesbania bispinosa]|nr:Pyrophosphate-energised proton pump [Sesbania bispinosa]
MNQHYMVRSWTLGYDSACFYFTCDMISPSLIVETCASFSVAVTITSASSAHSAASIPGLSSSEIFAAFANLLLHHTDKDSRTKLEWSPSPEPFHFGSFGSLDLHREEEDAPTGEDEDAGVQVAPIIKLEEIALSTGEEDDEPILDLKMKLRHLNKSIDVASDLETKLSRNKFRLSTISIAESQTRKNVCGLDRCIWISSELKEIIDDLSKKDLQQLFTDMTKRIFVSWNSIVFVMRASDAQKVFDEMAVRDVVFWSSMITVTQMGQFMKFEDKSETFSSHGGLTAAGAQVVMDAVNKPQNITYKGLTDLVTETDKMNGAAILEVVKNNFEDHLILGEEGGIIGDATSDYLWCIDPLDETTSFAHGYPSFAVSVEVLYRGNHLAASVVEFVGGPMCRNTRIFSATAGGGAFCNGQRIQVNATNQVEQSLLTEKNFWKMFDVGLYEHCRKKHGAAVSFGEEKVVKSWQLLLCVAVGLWEGLIIGFVTEYSASNAYNPVEDVADSYRTGAATNVIFGLALGYKSVIISIIANAISVFVSFTFAAIGKGFAIGSAALVSLALFGAFVNRAGISTVDVLTHDKVFIGLLVGAMLPYWFAAMYGTAVAALGMLSTVATGLAIEAYGPISDNAGAKFAEQHDEIYNFWWFIFGRS